MLNCIGIFDLKGTLLENTKPVPFEILPASKNEPVIGNWSHVFTSPENKKDNE